MKDSGVIVNSNKQLGEQEQTVNKENGRKGDAEKKGEGYHRKRNCKEKQENEKGRGNGEDGEQVCPC